MAVVGLGVRVQQQQVGVEEALRAFREQPREPRLPDRRFAVSAIARGIPEHRALDRRSGACRATTAWRTPASRRAPGCRASAQRACATSARASGPARRSSRPASRTSARRGPRRRVGIGERDLGRGRTIRCCPPPDGGSRVSKVTVSVSVPTPPLASVADTVMTFAPGLERDDGDYPTCGAASRAAASAIARPRHLGWQRRAAVPTSGMK